MHEVLLVNRAGGLSLPRKSVGKLTDSPDMTIDVYRGRKRTQQYNPPPRQRSIKRHQTSIHSNNIPRHDSSPNNKRTQSVSHSKSRPSTRTTFPHYFILPRLKSLRKQGKILPIHNMIYIMNFFQYKFRGGRGGLGGGDVC